MGLQCYSKGRQKADDLTCFFVSDLLAPMYDERREAPRPTHRTLSLEDQNHPSTLW